MTTASSQDPEGAKSGAGKNQPINLFDYEACARERLSAMAYDYLAAGAADEITLRRNRECFDRIRLQPRVLLDVSYVDTQVEVLGQTLDFPILLAPCAYHKLFHPEGERATARGAEAAGAIFVVSTFSTVAIEEIAQSTSARLWFQLYANPDRGFTREMVERAEAAGCQALCITVDTPILGTRDREKRSGFRLPADMERANLKRLGAEASRAQHHSKSAAYNLLDPALTWDTVSWIRSLTRMPVLLKGILAPEDARLAVEHGVSGILVSNHGGRNLDTVPATIEALPGVAEAVEGRCLVLLDGGIRRGTDVVKALALGAKAVLIGRPYLWGLAAEGAAGVARVIQILRAELEAAMRLCGTPRLEQINRRVLWRDT